MNKVVLIGRLTRDPDIRYSQGENATAVAKFSLAVDRKFKRQGESDADFINCVMFGKLAEHAERYYKQGIKIAVCGRMQTGSYVNKDGQKVYTTDVVIEESEFAESKGSSGGSSDQMGGYQPSARPSPSFAAGDGFMNIPEGIEEELPFN